MEIAFPFSIDSSILIFERLIRVFILNPPHINLARYATDPVSYHVECIVH